MSIMSKKTAESKPTHDHNVDLREALYNDCPIGPAGVIQVPVERITRLHGLMLDLDPKLLVPDNPLFPPSGDPRQFFTNIEPALNRHPLVRHAEIRASGTGLHAIVRLDPAVELKTTTDQKRWSTLVRAVQYSLPADPHAPGISGLSRPISSINSKNGAAVEMLRPGEPIDPRQVEAFVSTLDKDRFRTVALVLLGSERVLPCPVCRGEGTRFDVLDHSGMCYGRCGKVSLAQLFDVALKPFEHAGKADSEKTREVAPEKRPASKSQRPTTKTRRRPDHK